MEGATHFIECWYSKAKICGQSPIISIEEWEEYLKDVIGDKKRHGIITYAIIYIKAKNNHQ